MGQEDPEQGRGLPARRGAACLCRGPDPRGAPAHGRRHRDDQEAGGDDRAPGERARGGAPRPPPGPQRAPGKAPPARRGDRGVPRAGGEGPPGARGALRGLPEEGRAARGGPPRGEGAGGAGQGGGGQRARAGPQGLREGARLLGGQGARPPDRHPVEGPRGDSAEERDRVPPGLFRDQVQPPDEPLREAAEEVRRAAGAQRRSGDLPAGQRPETRERSVDDRYR
mmetsp:Transcript_1124/g.3110  ORF Transcript_1124/g.3110 Transcript_1124/m.3110 type:complete len:225 (-) Transcript_1124:1493-2167(-)